MGATSDHAERSPVRRELRLEVQQRLHPRGHHELDVAEVEHDADARRSGTGVSRSGPTARNSSTVARSSAAKGTRKRTASSSTARTVPRGRIPPPHP